MSDVRLTDEQWTKMLGFLRGEARAYVGNEANCRGFIEGVKWVARSGAQWRLLPAEFGNWNTVFKRFGRWCEHGVWERMLAYFADDPDMENGMVDSTIVRAHPCAAGSPQKMKTRRSGMRQTTKPWGAAEAASAPKSI
jgi:transposase